MTDDFMTVQDCKELIKDLEALIVEKQSRCSHDFGAFDYDWNTVCRKCDLSASVCWRCENGIHG